MESTKFVGMDVHKDAITIAVMNSAGKVIMESIIETKAVTILQFIQGLRGDLHVTFEEGTWATWLYDLLKPHVTKVVVCPQGSLQNRPCGVTSKPAMGRFPGLRCCTLPFAFRASLISQISS